MSTSKKCYLCGGIPSIYIRERNNVCSGCFFHRIRHSFRHFLATSLGYLHHRILVIFDGSLSSRVLVHLVFESMSSFFEKRMCFSAEILDLTSLLPYDHLNTVIDCKASEEFLKLCLEKNNENKNVDNNNGKKNNNEVIIHKFDRNNTSNKTPSTSPFLSLSTSTSSSSSHILTLPSIPATYFPQLQYSLGRKIIVNYLINILARDCSKQLCIPLILHPQCMTSLAVGFVEKVSFGMFLGDDENENENRSNAVENLKGKYVQKEKDERKEDKCINKFPIKGKGVKGPSNNVDSKSSIALQPKILFPLDTVQWHEAVFYIKERAQNPLSESLLRKKKKEKKVGKDNEKQAKMESKNSIGNDIINLDPLDQPVAGPEEDLFLQSDATFLDRLGHSCLHSSSTSQNLTFFSAFFPPQIPQSCLISVPIPTQQQTSSNSSISHPSHSPLSSSVLVQSNSSSTSDSCQSLISGLFFDMQKEGFNQSCDVLLSTEKKLNSFCTPPSPSHSSSNQSFSPSPSSSLSDPSSLNTSDSSSSLPSNFTNIQRCLLCDHSLSSPLHTSQSTSFAYPTLFSPSPITSQSLNMPFFLFPSSHPFLCYGCDSLISSSSSSSSSSISLLLLWLEEMKKRKIDVDMQKLEDIMD